MARVIPNNLYITSGDTDGVSRNSTGSGSFGSSSSVPHDYSNSSLIAKQVINSPSYKSAYQVLSHENDKSWLQRLEMIPYSVQDASSTFLDDLGLVNNQKDKQSANYQYCLEQISALMAEYQSWKNSLPITQSQQFADAGINSAITGQGINNSEIPNVGVGTDPSSLQSANVGDFFLNASSFILDSVNGLASVSLGFKQLGYQQDTQYFEFLKYLREEGISYKFEGKYPRNLSEFFDRTLTTDENDPFTFIDAKGDRIASENVIESILHHEKFAPLYLRWKKLLSSDPTHPSYPYLSGDYSIDIPIGVEALTDAEYKSFMTSFERKLLEDKLSITQLDNTLSLQDKEKEIKSLQNSIFDLQIKEAKIKFDLIDKLHNSSSLEDKLLLQKILLGFNTTDIQMLSNELSFQNTEKSLGIVGSIINMLK